MSSILAIAAISLSVGSADLHPLLASPPQNAWFMLDSTSERDATWAVCIRLKTQDDATRVADLVPSLGGIVRSRLLTVPMLTCEIPHQHVHHHCFATWHAMDRTSIAATDTLHG